ncbi:uncharacterized protein ACBT57_021425 isoform 1-T1 [Dama dama]
MWGLPGAGKNADSGGSQEQERQRGFLFHCFGSILRISAGKNIQDAEPPRVELLISIYRVNVTERMGVPPPAGVFHSPAVNHGLCNGPAGEGPCCQRKSIALFCKDQSRQRPGPKPAQTQQVCGNRADELRRGHT